MPGFWERLLQHSLPNWSLRVGIQYILSSRVWQSQKHWTHIALWAQFLDLVQVWDWEQFRFLLISPPAGEYKEATLGFKPGHGCRWLYKKKERTSKNACSSELPPNFFWAQQLLTEEREEREERQKREEREERGERKERGERGEREEREEREERAKRRKQRENKEKRYIPKMYQIYYWQKCSNLKKCLWAYV